MLSEDAGEKHSKLLTAGDLVTFAENGISATS